MGAKSSKHPAKEIDPRALDPQRASKVDLVTEAQIAEFRDAFNSFDRDGSGHIDKEELKLLCEWVGQETTEAEIDEMMAMADGDGSGKIDLWEFITLMAHKMGDRNPSESLHSAFSVFDKDESGYINADEIKEVMRTMGEPVDDKIIEAVLDGMDKDGDGLINYEEFAFIVTKEMRSSGYSIM